MEEQQRVLVLDVGMDKMTFSIFELGYEQELQSIKEELPRETDPFRPGKEERHRLTHVKWHFKAAAQLADRLFKERGCDLVMLIGEETVVKEFEDYLPKALQDRVLARTSLSVEDGPNRRRAAIENALAEQRKKEEEAAIDHLGFYQGHGRVAAGLELVVGGASLLLMR